jgi:hypothetical protein
VGLLGPEQHHCLGTDVGGREGIPGLQQQRLTFYGSGWNAGLWPVTTGVTRPAQQVCKYILSLLFLRQGLAVQPKLALNSQSSCFSLPSAGITRAYSLLLRSFQTPLGGSQCSAGLTCAGMRGGGFHPLTPADQPYMVTAVPGCRPVTHPRKML